MGSLKAQEDWTTVHYCNVLALRTTKLRHLEKILRRTSALSTLSLQLHAMQFFEYLKIDKKFSYMFM